MKRILLLTLNFSLLTSLSFAQSFPKPTGRVNDFANVINPAVELEIDQQLDELEQRTSSEIAVATIRSLDGMSVDEYANRLFKEWGVGQAKQDNGVLVLVAIDDRIMKIEVGYGLEGVLPDGLAGQVIREDFTPRFKEEDYAGGIRAGVRRLVDIVEKNQVLTPEELARFNEGNGNDDVPIYVAIPFFGLFVTIGFGMLGIGLRSKTGFPVLFGSLFGGMPLLMSLAFMSKMSLYTLFPWALAMLVTGYRPASAADRREAAERQDDGKSTVRTVRTVRNVPTDLRVFVLARESGAGAHDVDAAVGRRRDPGHDWLRRRSVRERWPLRGRRVRRRGGAPIRARWLRLVWFDGGERDRLQRRRPGAPRRVLLRHSGAEFSSRRRAGASFFADVDRCQGSGEPPPRSDGGNPVLAAVSTALGCAGQPRTELSVLCA
jgi:uncharacterized protein